MDWQARLKAKAWHRKWTRIVMIVAFVGVVVVESSFCQPILAPFGCLACP